MFWDSSALVPVLLPERRSRGLVSTLRSSGEPTVWWSSVVECQSALHRRHREKPLPQEVLEEAVKRLEALFQSADTVAPTEEVRSRARRLLAVHNLRAADALQLAAALVWCQEQPAGEAFVCLDDRLREAARREGFSLIPS